MLLLQTVAELGVVIFNALDFGLKVSLTSSMSIGRSFCYRFKLSFKLSKQEDEERQLSPALENIIDMMTSSGEYDDIISDDDTMKS